MAFPAQADDDNNNNRTDNRLLLIFFGVCPAGAVVAIAADSSLVELFVLLSACLAQFSR